MVSHGWTMVMTEEAPTAFAKRDGGLIVDEAENVRLDDITGAVPRVTYEKDGRDPHARLRLDRRLRRVSRRLAPEHLRDA